MELRHPTASAQQAFGIVVPQQLLRLVLGEEDAEELADTLGVYSTNVLNVAEVLGYVPGESRP